MQRYFASSRNGDSFLLRDGDLHHICNVMRIKSGEFVEVVFENVLYKCKVLIDNGVSILYDSIIDNGMNDFFEVVLIVPVLKEQKMDYILQKSTELGVSRIIPIVTERTVVKVNDKETKKIDRWSKIVKEASEQCKRYTIPVIDNIKTINELDFSDGVKLVCSTLKNQKSIKKLLHNDLNCAKIYIVVGPEGGLSINEEKKLNELGFVSISLGNRIMRVETVPLFVLSVLNYELME